MITPQQRQLAYTAGFKYQLVTEVSFVIPSLAEYGPVSEKYYALDDGGSLTLKEGFASDGPSGPTIDTPSAIRGAFVHDVLYEMMRKGILPIEFRKQADEIIEEMCTRDGMWSFRAKMWRVMLSLFGEKNARASHRRPVKYAP